MRTKLILVSILLLFQTAVVANAAKKKKEAPRKGAAELGTSFRFDGKSLHGKYQNSPSSTAIVEDDKWLEDLLGARKNFADRIEKDRDRN